MIVIVVLSIFIPVRNTFSQTLQSDDGYSEQSYDIDDLLEKLSGDITFKYKGRNAEGENGSDQDFRESLKVRYGDAYNDKVAAYLYGTLRQDLEDPGSSFSSIDDTYDKSIRGYLYEAYGVVNDLRVVDNVKIGRQYANEVEDLHFDGVNLTFKPVKNVRISSYGGVPVYFYESSSDGDWLAGLSAEITPLKSSTLRLDYIASSDNNSDFGDHHDNLFIFSAWQNIKPWWNVYGRYSMIDSISRDVQLISTWNFNSINLDVQFSFYRQPQTLDDFTVEFDEFVSLVGGYQPFDQYTLDIYKGLGQHMGVNVGASLRELKDESDESSFNHDYDRYYITYSVFDLLLKGLAFSATAESFESGGDDVQSLSFDITYKIKKSLKVSVGTYYSLYKYDTSIAPELVRSDDITDKQFLLAEPLTDMERDNVRSYYLKAKKRIFDRWEVNGKYEFENYDSEIFHTVEAALKLKF